MINTALYTLHQVGWVHRDVSNGNILVLGDDVKLADLEYAKRVRHDEPPHAGIRTVSWISMQPRWYLNKDHQGTEDFMSVEVLSQTYCFGQMEKIPPVKPSHKTMAEYDRLTRKVAPVRGPGGRTPTQEQSTIPARGWFYNPLHDLESILWLFVRQLLFRDHYIQWPPADTSSRPTSTKKMIHSTCRPRNLESTGLDDSQRTLPSATHSSFHAKIASVLYGIRSAWYNNSTSTPYILSYIG